MALRTGVLIGVGGMGEVYRAWDPDLERFVALKYLRSGDPELVERLLREARAQARVDHPGVCKVYEVGVDDGRPFIAMQYVDGPLLSEAAPTMSLEQKVLTMLKVAEAVQAAHSAGLVHRDLKPGNIKLEVSDDGELHPFVLDFGIARLQEVAGLTATGQVLGTPGYLSPEQARGEVSRLDRRSDIFSLGVILYELVSGKRPFEGDSGAAVLVKLLQEEPLPLRRRSPHLPRDLETVVMRCLEKEPERRYPSARELADDLGRFLRGEPILARPRTLVERWATTVRRHPRTSAALAVSAAVALLAVALALESRASAARRAALAQRFGQEVERVEGVLQRAYLLPLHDIRAEKGRVRELVEWVDAESRSLGKGSLAAGHYAAGRGLLALDQAEPARARLQAAWDLGYRSPAVASALGLALARLYRSALQEADEVLNVPLRERMLREAEERLRQPAAEYLAETSGAPEPAPYLAAILAFVTGDDAGALSRLAELEQSDPFYYEGDLLAGVVHRRRYQAALDSGAAGEAELAFAQARRAFAAATEVGESDPRPYQELCGLWVQELRMRVYTTGGEVGPARDAALESCRAALVADPDSAAAHLEAGRAHRYWAEQLLALGQPASEAFAAARQHAREALRVDPASDDAYILIGVTHRQAANALAEAGGDPRADLEAAVAAFAEALRLNPNDYGATVSLSNALLYLGADARARGGQAAAHFRAAIQAARQATELEGNLVGAWVNLGIAHGQLAAILRDSGGDPATDMAAGVAALERAIEVNPRFLTAHFNLAELLLQEAQGKLRRGRDPTAEVARAHQLLAPVHEANTSWAAPHFLAAFGHALAAEHRRLTGADPSEQLALGESSLAAGRRVRGIEPDGLALAAATHLEAARWAVATGRDPSAAVKAGLATVDAALGANPAHMAATVRRAELLLVAAAGELAAGRSPASRLAAAEEAVGRALAVNPDDVEAVMAAAEIWRRWGEWRLAHGGDAGAAVDRGLGLASHAIRLNPLRAEAWALRAGLERLASRLAAAGPARDRHVDAARSARARAHELDPLLCGEQSLSPTPPRAAGAPRVGS